MMVADAAASHFVAMAFDFWKAPELMRPATVKGVSLRPLIAADVSAKRFCNSRGRSRAPIV